METSTRNYIQVEMSSRELPPFMETEGSLPYSQPPSKDPVRSQLNPIHTYTFYFLNIVLKSITLHPKQPVQDI